MVHGETEDTISHLMRIGQVIWVSRLQAAIGGELGYQWIEIPTAKDILFLHLEVELVTGHAIRLGIHKDGEVAIVVLHARHIVEEGDALDIAKGLPVLDSDLLAGGNTIIYQLKIKQAVGGTDLVHLTIDAWTNNGSFIGKTEVLQEVNALLGLFIGHNHRTTLNGVVDLGGMEAQRAHIAPVEYRLGLYGLQLSLDGSARLQCIARLIKSSLIVGLMLRNFESKSMSCVVDDFETIGVGNLLDTAYIAGLAVAVHGHDGRGTRCDGSLNLLGIEITCARVDIDKDRLAARPPNTMCGGHKTIGGCNDLTRDA